MNVAPFNSKNENYHLGHLFLDAMKKNPDAICQIDAATGESETNASVLSRSIRLARCFLKFGVKPGDVLALGGLNHLDLHIPFYAALLTGMPICGVDPQFKYNQIKKVLQLAAPRIVFCQQNLLEENQKAVEELGLNAEVICFGDGDHSLAKFIEKFDDKNNTEEYVPPIFDLNKIYVWLVSTGGTTGVVKLAAITHRNFLIKMHQMKDLFILPKKEANGGPVYGIHLSPVQWISSYFNIIFMPISGQIKVQSSAPHTTEHIIDIINKYKPKSMFLSPSVATSIVRGDKECDFSSLDSIALGGGKVHKDLILELKKRMKPGAAIIEAYGQTENMGAILAPQPCGPIGNCGKASPVMGEVKLVDPETGKEITEPNVQGELWTKGVSFTEYYRNPEETAKTFTKDGWLKTGDIMYRDDEGYFFFVERFSMLIKYRSYHIVPVELEALIREHPGVKDVSVTSIPHVEDGEHAVACVVRRTGCDVTPSEIKEIIATKLSDSQKLRGGVVFMDELPMTSSGKVARGKLREIVRTAHRE